MVTAVCLNPCLDKVLRIQQFTYGGMNRVSSSRMDASGKGVNVGIGVARLGFAKATVTGFLYTENGQAVARRLENEGVTDACIWRSGAVRTNLKIFDESQGVVTEVNEAGQPVDEQTLAALETEICTHAVQSRYMVFTGSLPPGCGPDTYARLMQAVRAVNPSCRLILDAEGETLRCGLQAKPYLIKPNRYELETLVKRPLPALEDVNQEAQKVSLTYGCLTAVSLGAEGALLTDGKQSVYAPGIRVTVASTVGAGDSLLVGLLSGDAQGDSMERMLAYGVAAATSACLKEGTSLFTRQGLEEMLPRVMVQKYVDEVKER